MDNFRAFDLCVVINLLFTPCALFNIYSINTAHIYILYHVCYDQEFFGFPPCLTLACALGGVGA